MSDKFGFHGIISAVVLEKQEQHLYIDNWVMSCRVLKRGVEYFILQHLRQVAEELGVCELRGSYLPTPKNRIVAHLLDDLGFEKRIDYSMFAVKHQKIKDHHIKSRK